MDGLNMALALPTVGQISVYFLRHTLVCFLKHWRGNGAGTGAEQAENLVSGSEAGVEAKRSGSGAESRSRRNRFERGAENMPLPLRSHALVQVDLTILLHNKTKLLLFRCLKFLLIIPKIAYALLIFSFIC